MLILVLVFAPRLARTEWAEVRAQEEVVATQGWAETQWIRLNTAIDDAVNRYYLRRYDRRAPLEPTPAAYAHAKAAAHAPGHAGADLGRRLKTTARIR